MVFGRISFMDITIVAFLGCFSSYYVFSPMIVQTLKEVKEKEEKETQIEIQIEESKDDEK